MAVRRPPPLDAAAAAVLAATVLLFAFGSSSVPQLASIGSRGRWAALFALALLALGRAVRGARPRRLPLGWAIAAALLLLGADSVLWSVDVHATAGRIFTLGVLFVAAAAFALGDDDPRRAAALVLDGVLAGVALVALASLIVLVAARHDAVAPVTGGWRFQGVGENPNTVPMLLAAGLPIAVWAALARRGRARLPGLALVLLFAGEIAASGSRGALAGGFAGAVVTASVLGGSRRARATAAAAVVGLAAVSVAASRLPSAAAASPAPTAPAASAQAPSHRGIDAEQAFRLEDEIGYPLRGAYSPPAPRTLFGSSGRAQAWNGAVGQALERPVAGYGFGTESEVFVDRYYSFEGDFVENTYIGLLLQLGAVGLALFVGLLVVLAWNGVRAAVSGVRPAAAALGVLVAAILLGVGQSGILSAGNIAAVAVWVSVLTLPALDRSLRR